MRLTAVVFSEDIPFSATRSNWNASQVKQVLPYIAPHPQRGTPYHRYVTLLLSRDTSSSFEDGVSTASAPSSVVIDRHGFSIASYLASRNLTVSGIHFFRSQWTEGSGAEAVRQVYRDVLKENEPFFSDQKLWKPYTDPVTGLEPSKYAM